ncbi:HK97-gp10 family putative phage morphogenesis protein [Chelativorans oligotrophicus]|uniref:HK97-gp10 family putative phage morphogenesis protein n=1 Tax=Chelativorans oligotrophicus TaxID=449974 RepID=UPI001FE91FF5|nr:HK97-gp10 family putative phage morphogenesis protein [Chelativorans oligotrophicus]
MATRVRIDGLRELEKALAELPKATGKNVLRRTLLKAGQPIADDYEANVRRLTGTLAESAGVSTKLSRRQASQHRKMFRDDKASAEVFAGAGALVQAITEEFGTDKQAPQGALREAWDANKMSVLDTIKTELGNEITKAAERLARKAARQAAKG